MNKEPKGILLETDYEKEKREKKSENKPECFGSKAKCVKNCKFKKECFKLHQYNLEEKKQNKRSKRERFKDKIKYKIVNHYSIIRAFFYKFFSVNYWINFIQKFEPLFEVLFIDGLMIILLGAIGFCIYFLYIANWIMTLCSIAAFLAIGFILDRMDNKNKNNIGGSL